MGNERKIKKVIQSKPTLEGAGVHLRRAFGFAETPQFDPFLLLDDFRGDDPKYFIKGFPWHPHRGIETITYMVEGTVEHGDSIGNSGVIGPGDVQWMTAGNGIIHQEMPKGDDRGRMGGFQLWANLPASHKMMDPRYRDIKDNQIPRVTMDNGVEIRVICGRLGDVEGPVTDVVIEPEYLDVSLAPNSRYSHPTVPGHNVFAYVIDGKAVFCGEKDPFSYRTEGENYFDFEKGKFLGNGSLVLFDDGDQLNVSTEDEPARFLLISGQPIEEPIAWYGPIVMNTQEELETAFREYREGTFIKKGKK